MVNDLATDQSSQHPLLRTSIDLGSFITKLLAGDASHPVTTIQRWLPASTKTTSNHTRDRPLHYPVLRLPPDLDLLNNALLPSGAENLIATGPSWYSACGNTSDDHSASETTQ